MKKVIQIWAWIVCFGGFFSLEAQFAPAAGKNGSTAIHADSSCFINWAKECTVNRGLAQINILDSGYATVGTANAAIGKALSNGVVSLGDGGSAILVFDPPISDEPGFDFAIFENAFLDTFLEFAHVEVSNDKIHWTKFPSTSYTQTLNQTGPFGFSYPEKINNLAGKYKMPYGVPFDLNELKDSLNYSNSIQYIRITDVVGSIDPQWGSKDSKNNLINDPWPTPFPSSGFDLDAVGVIHESLNTNGIQSFKQSANYSIENSVLHFKFPLKEEISIFSSTGSLVFKGILNGNDMIIPQLTAGVYFIHGLSFSVKTIIQ